MVTHTTVGFKGTVRQDGEARRMARLGPRLVVASAADWAVTPTSADRTVSIAPGSGQACGVTDTTTAAETLQLPVNSSGQTRYDLIINRFKWTDPVTDPVFTYVQGTPGAGVPNLAGLVRTPGTQYDGVLAVARVASGQGALSGNDVFSLAPVGGNGALTVPQLQFLAAVDAHVGTDLISPVTEARFTKVASYGASAADGTAVPAGAWIGRLRATRTAEVTNNAGGFVVPFGISFTKLIDVGIYAGDSAGPLNWITPIGSNHTVQQASGQAWYVPPGGGTALTPNGATIRATVDVVGYIA